IGSGTITYKGDSFSGTVDMTVKGMGMKMKSTMKGRRLGACK
ncbi:MAG: DUF3617 family protein, partial [Deltaproteobacteria bacterium]|nr:DUF3617 family protein [Deltaproteobacteria bacterium]